MTTAAWQRSTAEPASDVAARPGAQRTVLERLRRGHTDDPSWVRPSLLGLLLATAVLYLWDLGASGMANSFYAAAVQAGTVSWKAMLFGSLDSGNAITVDKPAMSLWPMEIAGRLFGFSSWSMLVPQALMGVASVALVYAAVRRVTGRPAFGLVAGAAVATTPVAVLMFRFNNPDALLVLLLTASGYAVVRALQAASGRWLALAGLLVGLGFITKMGQALLVVPGLALAYLVAAPTSLGRRLVHLLASGAAMVAGAGWYIALVDLWPAGSRPYIGGSTDNSLLQLALGYNGLGRLFGNTAGNGGGNGGPGGGGGGGGMGGGFGGATGWGRMFRGDFAGEISWLLPTALLALVAGLVLLGRARRTDLRRAALIAFGGSLVVTLVVFSFMQGVIHPYYAVALAPLIAVVLGVTGAVLWEQRSTWAARGTAAVLLETTVLWDVHLLGSWSPALRTALIVASVLAVVALLFPAELGRRLTVVGLVAALLAGGGATAAWAAETAVTPHSGSIPTSGPASAGGGSGGSGGFARGGGDAQSSTNTALTSLLQATTTRWAAATNGSMSSAPLQLASGKAVMAIGGFNGSDASPTLAQFQAEVAAGQISYYVVGGGMGGGPGGGSSEIASWVAQHYTATTVGGATVYKLVG